LDLAKQFLADATEEEDPIAKVLRDDYDPWDEWKERRVLYVYTHVFGF